MSKRRFNALRAEEEHAEELARSTGKPWVVYRRPLGDYRSYSVENLSRLKRHPAAAELPLGRIVYLARGRASKRTKTRRTR